MKPSHIGEGTFRHSLDGFKCYSLPETPLHPSSVFTQLPGQGLPTCAGHTRMHRHTQVPHPTLHAYLPTYLRRRPEGRGPARVSRFSPHPAAVESHGPPPAPVTKQHNNRLSEFR